MSFVLDLPLFLGAPNASATLSSSLFFRFLFRLLCHRSCAHAVCCSPLLTAAHRLSSCSAVVDVELRPGLREPPRSLIVIPATDAPHPAFFPARCNGIALRVFPPPLFPWRCPLVTRVFRRWAGQLTLIASAHVDAMTPITVTIPSSLGIQLPSEGLMSGSSVLRLSTDSGLGAVLPVTIGMCFLCVNAPLRCLRERDAKRPTHAAVARCAKRSTDTAAWYYQGPHRP